MQNIATAQKIALTTTAQSTTSAEVNSTAVDTQGYDGILFCVPLSAARTVKLQGGLTATSATTDITGCSVTATAAGLVMLEMHRPQYRYVRATTITGATAIVGDTVTIMTPSRSLGISNSNYALVTTTTD